MPALFCVYFNTHCPCLRLDLGDLGENDPVLPGCGRKDGDVAVFVYLMCLLAMVENVYAAHADSPSSPWLRRAVMLYRFSLMHCTIQAALK